MRYKAIIQFSLLAAGLMLLLHGCCVSSIPSEALQLAPDSLKQRELESRRFDIDEKSLLSAAAALLQDEGFVIEESAPAYGLIFGSKHRDASTTGQTIGAFALALLTGFLPPVDRDQWIRVAVVTHPLVVHSAEPTPCRTAVRVTFQRVVFNDRGMVSRQEGIVEPEIYRDFFNRLSQALFLEANGI